MHLPKAMWLRQQQIISEKAHIFKAIMDSGAGMAVAYNESESCIPEPCR
jgi:hypothetical protein